MHGEGGGGDTYHRIFSPFSPLASVRPALAAAVAASCVEALKKKKTAAECNVRRPDFRWQHWSQKNQLQRVRWGGLI